MPKFLHTYCVAANRNEQRWLVALKTALTQGQVVCFPTETVYALSVNLYDPAALQKLYQLKARDPQKPFALFVKNQWQLQALTTLDLTNPITPQQPLAYLTRQLVRHFCPGALTLIVPAATNLQLQHLMSNPTTAIPPTTEEQSEHRSIRSLSPSPQPQSRHLSSSIQPTAVTSSAWSLGIRIPRHSFALKLLKRLNFPIAATSCNLSGQAALNSPQAIRRTFSRSQLALVAPIFPQGTPNGRSSTIIDCTHWPPQLIRPGTLLKSINHLRKRLCL